MPAGGAENVTAQLKGATPPETDRGSTYTTPLVALGSGLAVVMSGAGAMVSVKVWLADALGTALSLPRSVTWKLPALVGMPVIVPTPPLSVSPGGRTPDRRVQL